MQDFHRHDTSSVLPNLGHFLQYLQVFRKLSRRDLGQDLCELLRDFVGLTVLLHLRQYSSGPGGCGGDMDLRWGLWRHVKESPVLTLVKIPCPPRSTQGWLKLW